MIIMQDKTLSQEGRTKGLTCIFSLNKPEQETVFKHTEVFSYL